MNPIIAIIGRPNVGKSTLFNRISRKRLAIVEDIPGVTRDRNYHDVAWDDHRFTVVDTGGFEPLPIGGILGMIREQTQLAIDEADVILLLFDGKVGLTPSDIETVNMLRKIPKPVYYIINKIDGPKEEDAIADFYKLGISRFYSISALHGLGVSDMIDDVLQGLPKTEDLEDEKGIKVAIVGRPNVGKSSLINRLCGEERSVVHEAPGTTRDSIDTRIIRGDRLYTLIDTAGIRRKGKTTETLEKYCVLKALRSLDRCDVALILIDAKEGVTEQDTKIAGYAMEKGRGCILVMNKWDLISKDHSTMGEYVRSLRSRLKFLNFSPIAFISALTGQRVGKVLELVDLVNAEYHKRIETGPLNRHFAQWLQEHPPAIYRNRRIKFYYATQVSIKPPAFAIFTNYPQGVHFSYKRYIINRIREAFGFQGTPIRIFFKARSKKRGH